MDFTVIRIISCGTADEKAKYTTYKVRYQSTRYGIMVSFTDSRLRLVAGKYRLHLSGTWRPAKCSPLELKMALRLGNGVLFRLLRAPASMYAKDPPVVHRTTTPMRYPSLRLQFGFEIECC